MQDWLALVVHPLLSLLVATQADLLRGQAIVLTARQGTALHDVVALSGIAAVFRAVTRAAAPEVQQQLVALCNAVFLDETVALLGLPADVGSPAEAHGACHARRVPPV